MSFEITLFSSAIIQKQAVHEIIKCNELTKRFGLVLTPEQAMALVETRSYALSANGRIEFGGGVIDKIIKEFCTSPYIYMQNYTETLHDLLELFYYYKNETLDLMTDEELIKYMKKCFDGVCQGSLKLLADRELANMARNVRYGYAPDYSEDDVENSGKEG